MVPGTRRVGASVETTLAAQAEALRARRQQDALKRIGRAAVAAVPPTLLCGFPILALLIFFPAVLELWDAFRLLRGIF